MSNTLNNDQKVQVVFDKVIKSGCYPVPNCLSSFMCEALSNAVEQSIITNEEYGLAKYEIENYIAPYWTLSHALREKFQYSIPSSIDIRLNIYSNWANRPKLKEI